MPDASLRTTRLYLVRHGATQLTAEDRFSGANGAELSADGRAQAELLGERLRRENIAAAYCSPLSRTVETARLIVARCGLTASTSDGLREISHGHWEGLSRAEVEQRYGAEYAAWEADPFTFAPEGGESGVEVLARALPALREIVTRHPGERVLVVSHKATIRLLLSSLLGIDARGYRDRLDQAPACLNVLDFRGVTQPRLMLFNDTSHYSEKPRLATHSLSKWWDERGAS
ncbi:MAG: histidine phosphatase family protein [Acidobacteria bacterium]|nr:histidine phosphatase family protein [Acidobacteriota bacterium]MBV9478827.1 histidine phosphatase family protein [Acidobacteriota bacterium]